MSALVLGVAALYLLVGAALGFLAARGYDDEHDYRTFMTVAVTAVMAFAWLRYVADSEFWSAVRLGWVELSRGKVCR